MPSLEYPASFRSIWDPGPVHQGPKIKIFKKWKKHSQAFTQAINVARFSDLDHLPFPRAPRRFPVHLGSRTEPPRSKIKNIQKMKKKKKNTSGIHPSSKCAKSQTNLSIYGFPSVPRKFSVHLGSRASSPGPKNQNFQKMKKTLPGIHPSYKCSTFQWFRPFTLPESAPKVSSSFRVQDWAPKVQN